MSASGKRDILWIEAARTLAMALVILVHATGGVFIGGFAPGRSLAISVLACMAVPAFFMVSGFLLGLRPVPPGGGGGVSARLGQRLRVILVPFFAWNLIYMIVFKLDQGWPIFSGATVWFLCTGYSHLWFVCVLVQLLLLYAWLEPRLNGRGLPVALGVAAGLSLAFYALADVLAWVGVAVQGHNFEWYFGKALVPWGVFFFWGVWLGRKPALLPALARRRIALALATLVTGALYYGESELELVVLGSIPRQYFLLSGLAFQLVAGTAMLAFLQAWDASGMVGSWLRFLGKWGRDTYGVYLCHLAILLGLMALESRLGLALPTWPRIALLSVVTALLSLGLVRLLRLRGLVKGNWLLFGGR